LSSKDKKLSRLKFGIRGFSDLLRLLPLCRMCISISPNVHVASAHSQAPPHSRHQADCFMRTKLLSRAYCVFSLSTFTSTSTPKTPSRLFHAHKSCCRKHIVCSPCAHSQAPPHPRHKADYFMHTKLLLQAYCVFSLCRSTSTSTLKTQSNGMQLSNRQPARTQKTLKRTAVMVAVVVAVAASWTAYWGGRSCMSLGACGRAMACTMMRG